MKKILFITLLTLCQFIYAQDKGTLKGLLTDKETNNEPLPFANVLIKGTAIGVTTDFDGNYTLSVPTGTHIVVFSFLGYKTIEKTVTIKAGETVVVNQIMSAAEGVSLDEVVVKSSANKESASALLLEQKKATVIKESIGAQTLSKIGVSDAATATTKISGVTKSQGTGDIFIRGLGDRYLSTTMNGLPIPSDDVERKNINLSLFSTDVIKNVGISKTYATSGYSDQASGNVDVITKDYTKENYSVGVSGGANTSVLAYEGDFRTTIISNDINFGFHKKQYALQDLITYQGWDTEVLSAQPINYSGSLSAAKKFEIFSKDLSFYTTISHSKSFEYFSGEFQSFRQNRNDTSFDEVESFTTKTNTSGYLNFKLKLDDNNSVKFNTLFVNKGSNNLYEQGRNGLGFVYDQDPQEEGAFIRDQNFKQTTMFVNQLMGEHNLNDNNTLSWAGGYNYVLAEEPNRIRNEVNILDVESSSLIQYAHVGDYQQRKSTQEIEDIELNGFIKNNWTFGALNEDGDKPFALNYGVNYRRKEREFYSQQIGVLARNFTAPSVDELSTTFTQSNLNNGLNLRVGQADLFTGELNVLAAFTDFNFILNPKLSGNLGLRFEIDEINVSWDVANYVGRIGNTSKTYENLFPSLNLKYEVAENQYLRFATSLTQTLPEFKELSPFEYVSPTGRVSKGNPELEKSDVINVDLKWEFFPSRGEVFSLTGFYKSIKNPINLAQSRGSSGNFIFYNTGDKATVKGLEFETKTSFIKNEEDDTVLGFTANLTKMWFNQDLYDIFQYKGKTESDLQGASDLIVNGSLSYSSNKENEFSATLTGNYSSDKVFALGSPEDFVSSATLYNDEIIEKGFVSLDLVLSKELNEHLTVKFIGRNLLNPDIKQTQLVNYLNAEEVNEVVSNYKQGVQLSLGIKYTF
ncbi:TonB-dependent receptor [Polaribacter sargassicola]|uniref:TonB-dependent receptor n=1 Tax=Polaribacter sargassicola TaxID=2836891 RepID=UPI001F27E49C|nr:TonB-dependent receptor [Polaribacter sp. DS7-9]MCG1034884.1 TonB-dependent receptor [Polaribacter sp. DS7-9]